MITENLSKVSYYKLGALCFLRNEDDWPGLILIISPDQLFPPPFQCTADMLPASRTLPGLAIQLIRNTRLCSSFQIHEGSPQDGCSGKNQPPASVVVFGFAGSPKSQLEKMSAVYTEQGHRTLYCVLPQMVTFTYDMRKIRACAGQVLQKLEEQGVGEVVCHSLSNNGSVLYQQFTQMAKEKGSVTIKVILGHLPLFCHDHFSSQGAVFDSSPGPLGIQNVQRYFQLDGFATGIEKWVTRRQTPTFLPFHLFGVDMANRVPILTALGNVKKQLRYTCNDEKYINFIVCLFSGP